MSLKAVTTEDLNTKKANLAALLDQQQRQCAICIGNIWKIKKALAGTAEQLKQVEAKPTEGEATV